MNQSSEFPNDNNLPPKPESGDARSPEWEGSMGRIEPTGESAEIRRMKATIQKAEKLLAFGLAQEDEHLRASEVPRQRARACAATGDDDGAEAAWREVVAIEEQTGDVDFIAKAYLHLGHCLLRAGKDDAAFANSAKLVEVSRRAGFSFVLWTALEQRAVCAVRMRLRATAMEAADEALRLAQGCEDLVEHVAWTHVLRGNCLLEFGDVVGADRAAEKCREEFADQPGVKLMEVPFRWRIRWWELVARIRMEQQNVADSVEAWERVVAMRRTLFNHQMESWPRLVDGLLDWADALRIDGQSDEADAAEAEANRLQAEFDVSDVTTGDDTRG